MKKLLLLVALSSILVLFVNSCSDSSTSPTKPAKDIDELVRNAGKLDKSVVEKDEKIKDLPLSVVEEDGKKWNLKESTYSLAKNLGEGVNFNVNANTLWAGSLVQGKDLPIGILNSLGDNLDRSKITLTVKSGGSNLGSREIEKPSNSTYSAALQDILNKNTSKVTANQAFTMEYAFSEKQALMKLGISANWLSGSLNSQFKTEEKATEKNVFLMFKQTYFTVSTTEPTKPSDYFGDNIKTDDLSYYVNQNNPLCYVSSVDYGRIIIAKMTFKENISSTDLTGKIEQTFAGIFKGTAEGEFFKAEMQHKSTFKALILGGSAGGAANALISMDFSKLLELIKEEAEYSVNTPPYPISYVVKNLSDNSVVKLGETTEYTVKEYSENSENYQNFGIKLIGFYVYNDCEPYGDGNFYYSLDVLDYKNKSLIGGSIDVPKDQAISAGDAKWIYFKGQSEYSFSIFNQPNYYFKVKGKLSEKNSLVEDIVLDYDKTFSYPWDKNEIDNGFTIGSETGYYGLEIKRDDKCKIVLMIKITKK